MQPIQSSIRIYRSIPAGRRKNWLLSIQAVLAVVAITFLIKSIQLSQLLDSLSRLNLTLLSLALLLLPLNLYLEAKKWQILINKVSRNTSVKDAMGSMLVGFSLGLFTPARIGDYAGRSLYLDYRNKWELVALTFTDRMISLATYVLFGLLALSVFIWGDATIPGYLSYPVFYASVIIFLFISYCLINPGSIYRTIVSTFRIERLRSVISFLSRLSHRDVVDLLGLSIFRYLVFSTQFVVIVYSFGVDQSIFDLYLAASLVFLIKSIVPSVTLMELGIREGAAVFFFGAIGVSASVAFDAAFLLFALNIILPAMIGVPLIFKLKDWK